jgi:hypothetical protein
MRDKAHTPGSLGNSGRRLRLPQAPLEWLDSGAWRLPSGKALTEFALQAGFLAPLLFNVGPSGRSRFFETGGAGAARGVGKLAKEVRR